MLSLILGVSALLSGASAACSREALQKGANTYLTALTTGQNNFPDTLPYLEDFKDVSIKTGILSKPVKIAYNRTIYDTTACATFSEIIAPDNTPPYVVGAQVHYDDSGSTITKIDSIITHDGDWLFDPKAMLSIVTKENRGEIAEAQRDSRETLQKAADAYFDLFNHKVDVPFGNPCNRLEGGLNVPICSLGISSMGANMTDRRYVIDETVGTVDVFVKFGGPTPDSHEFRLENGKIRVVHTITKMIQF